MSREQAIGELIDRASALACTPLTPEGAGDVLAAEMLYDRLIRRGYLMHAVDRLLDEGCDLFDDAVVTVLVKAYGSDVWPW